MSAWVPLLALALAAAPPPLRSPSAELQTLHILMVFDHPNEAIRPSLKPDEQRLRQLWRQTLPAGRHTLTVLAGAAATPERILTYYRDLPVGSADGVLFYLSGHGKVDGRSPFGSCFDFACGKVLLRNELLRAIQGRHPAFVLVASDACHDAAQLTPGQIELGSLLAPDSVPPGRPAGGPAALHPTVRRLLFEARGVVDLTAAATMAYTDDAEGGLFTRAFCQLLTTPLDRLDENRNGTVVWPEAFAWLCRETRALSRRWHKEMVAGGEEAPDAVQTPLAYSLGWQLESARPILAVFRLHNTADTAVSGHYRWVGRTAWLPLLLQRGEKRLLSVGLPDGTTAAPDLQVQLHGVRVPRLRPTRLWSRRTAPAEEQVPGLLLEKREPEGRILDEIRNEDDPPRMRQPGPTKPR